MRITVASGSAMARNESVKFGSVVLRGPRPDPTELERNIIEGRAALARAAEVLLNPGVELKRTRGVPLYSVDPDDPEHLVRTIDGRRERGVWENGEFKVLG